MQKLSYAKTLFLHNLVFAFRLLCTILGNISNLAKLFDDSISNTAKLFDDNTSNTAKLFEKTQSIL